jgi:hypothetical protein
MHYITIAKNVYTRPDMRENGLYSNDSESIHIGKAQ